MNFESILFETPEDRTGIPSPEMPGFFVDLNLDQIVASVTKGKEEYDLRAFFWSPLRRLGAIEYRQEVMRELERPDTARVIVAFAQQMHNVRRYLARADSLYYPLQKQRWFLDAAEVYCGAVSSLAGELSAADVTSRGLAAFRGYLRDYSNSELFKSLEKETRESKTELADVEYCIRIKGKSVTVRRCESEADLSADVEKTFERFRQGEARDYRARFAEPVEMNEVEAQILELVAQLYPDTFDALRSYCERHKDFPDPTIVAFDREVQFYVAYLDFIRPIRAEGLSFCYPVVSDTSKEISDLEGFDLALANKFLSDSRQVVCNDFHLQGKERILVVSGPNQGGKTTFARQFGQTHYLASLGCPVPGKEAKLFLFDKLFTHFEKEENVEDLRSKLEDDLVRIHDILSEATPRSIIIANEILTSTTLNDAVSLSKNVMGSIDRLDLLCLWVTFVEELASCSDKAVSLVSLVVPEDPTLRTYKIARRPGDGISYAAAIAEKYGLTYGALKERIKP
ncbi:MAG: DNA mismatch repair protein MutS [Chloroflexi bacterium RBG_16_57_8]|nr:MAG: DNA mismatch repair protein MutS [Chloroflexi bacterium RBG_16_57_8]